MKNEFVPYDIALAMKELGFDEPCFGFYSLHKANEAVGGNYPCDGTNSAPLYQQAFRWFDYSSEWSGFIIPSKEEGCFEWCIQNYEDANYLTIESEYWYTGREEAELSCLRKLIEIVKQNNDE